DMAKAYSWADVCICRAGALTVAEVCCALRPSLFIPYPHAVDNHQRFNAQSVVEHGGGLIWQESESMDKFIEQFENLIDVDKHDNRVDRLKLVRKTQVADTICDLCEQVLT
ncbi:MAG: UDP-N-acetylglucosamine--N-acetylmuramyl-(pentapeptide) pyrophosphoryl-undecaprenol N-acetylglucosamine transferase, partial [Proteobacteria bacterium]|nr:UDP-N-acetylglucosamine--N-acetylmuramyl-(pentapeptide) pyrophosphoryl-undecaprenol N-acetylglucosamine transferase [Pseudomonadota bacterium]